MHFAIERSAINRLIEVDRDEINRKPLAQGKQVAQCLVGLRGIVEHLVCSISIEHRHALEINRVRKLNRLIVHCCSC